MRLGRSPLVKLPGVRRLAKRRHPNNPHARVLALQDLLLRAVDVSLPALSSRERRFLERYASGESIAAIGREMGMSRSHLSSGYRPTVGEAVAVALPETARTPEWTDRHGRLSLRAAIRSHDATPFVVPSEPELDPESVALGVFLDRSGSMDGPRMAAAQTAAATLHLACAELDIWHAVITVEGAESVVPTGDASERALARLLPNTGRCMAPAYEALLGEMTARSEALKVLVIIHDGEPHDPRPYGI